MSYILDKYDVFYDDQRIGSYYVYDTGKVTYYTYYGCPVELKKQLEELKLNEDLIEKQSIKPLSELIDDSNRVQGRKKIIYKKDHLSLEREPQASGERYSVYRRSAEEGEPDYSPLHHDAPHYEGPHTPKDMREWASWYAFNKMDDGTYEAELDEAWWWGGGHNDGGTIRNPIPEEWFELPYDEFLENVVCLSAAAHYGFTAEILKKKEGLKEFFGYE